MTNASLESMKQMKLQGMANTYESMLVLPVNKQPDAHQMIATLLESEQQHRHHKRMKMLLRLSKLRYAATIQDIDCSKRRNLSQEQLLLLAGGGYIERGRTSSSRELLVVANLTWLVPWEIMLACNLPEPFTSI